MNYTKQSMIMTVIFLAVNTSFLFAAAGESEWEKQEKQRALNFLAGGRQSQAPISQLPLDIQQDIAQMARTMYQNITVENVTLAPVRVRISEILSSGQYRLLIDDTLNFQHADFNTGYKRTYRLPVVALRLSFLKPTATGFGPYLGTAELRKEQVEGLSNIHLEGHGLGQYYVTLLYRTGRMSNMKLEYKAQKNPASVPAKP